MIAPYRAQVAALRRHLEVHLRGCGSTFEVNTADQYQGRDKSVIIVSFVDCLHAEFREKQDAEAVRA